MGKRVCAAAAEALFAQANSAVVVESAFSSSFVALLVHFLVEAAVG
jgi:hypothetical protein